MTAEPTPMRPDVAAAIRGGDVEQGMDGEREIATASLEEAMFWRRTYTEIVAVEEGVMARVRELMDKQSATARREIELSNVPVIASQLDRFRSRLVSWEARLRQLDTDGHAPAELTP